MGAMKLPLRREMSVGRVTTAAVVMAAAVVLVAVAMRAVGVAQPAPGGQPLMLESAIEVWRPPADTRVDLADATSGDEAVVTITFTNVSGDRIHDARISALIPPGFQYLEGSAQGPGAVLLFSVDGGERFATADELQAPPEAYTHIRWILAGPFDPGARGHVRYRAGHR